MLVRERFKIQPQIRHLGSRNVGTAWRRLLYKSCILRPDGVVNESNVSRFISQQLVQGHENLSSLRENVSPGSILEWSYSITLVISDITNHVS